MSKAFILKFILAFAFLILMNPVLAQGPLFPPTLTYPLNIDSPIWAGKIEFKWTDSGANYYNYFINLPDGTSREGVIISNFVEIYDLKLGNHSWAVRSCEDVAAGNCGAWSNTPPEGFQIVSAPPEFLKGLVPCERQYDNPQTDIIESKPCGFTDIFILFKIVLDFLLWRAGPVILILLAIATGVIFYFSVGAPTAMVRIKTILKSAINGYLIIFLAWTMINMILRILGITAEWWVLPF